MACITCRVSSLVLNVLRTETKGSWFETANAQLMSNRRKTCEVDQSGREELKK